MESAEVTGTEVTGSATRSARPGADRRSAAEDVLIEIVLVALADPMRRRILNALSSAGGGTATTLAEGLPVSRQAVVKHLGVLQQAELVVGRKIGREVRYSLAPAPLEETARWMNALASEWDRPLATVKTLAEQEVSEPEASEERAEGAAGRRWRVGAGG